MTFNPGAIPVALLALMFAGFIGTQRGRLIDRYAARRDKTRSPVGRLLQMGYLAFMSVALAAMAVFVLFFDFEQ